MDASESPTVAVPQTDVADLHPETNRERIADRAAGLPDAVDVALFPEYALTGFVDDERAAEAALDRETAVDWLREIATDADVDVLAGYLERGDDALYNATAYVAADGTATVYRKRHLWGAEADRLAAGDERVVVDTPAGRTGLLTCYDLNFVEESAWHTEQAVDALFVPGAWPAAHGANWRLLLRARALDGVRWVVGAGRTGQKDLGEGSASAYNGRSVVVRPDGAVAAALGRGERDLVATLDREVLAECRETIRPDLEDPSVL